MNTSNPNRSLGGAPLVGSPYDVWAPDADEVSVVVNGSTHALARASDASRAGWWSTSPELVRRAGDDYGFVLDGKGPFPDPRSLSQPAGVHELSHVYDPTSFAWTDAAWTGRQLAGSVIYELHIGTFTPEGTFDAAAERLDHLVSLGVDFVEILPVNAFNGTHNWGYDGVLWYAVQEQYGGPDGYQRFVDSCHAAGVGVVQDVVYNHLGPSGNYLPEFGPYLHTEKGNTWGSSLNLDGPGSDEVRRYIIDNALHWLDEYHVDALRLDAVHALTDARAVHLLEELAAEVDALSAHLRRPLTLIAESDLNDPRLVTPREGGGYGLHAQWSDDFHHSVHVALTGETTGYYADFASLDALEKVLTQGFFHNGTLSTFRGRHHGRPVDTAAMPTWRLVVGSQNHDQIGNRAIGDRLTATLDDGQLGIAAALTLLGPFTPMLFMGEEWAASTPWQFFTSHPEPELGEATAKGRIAEFAAMGWDESVVPDPQDPETFTRSKLDWDEAGESGAAESGVLSRHSRVLALYRALGALRRREREITDPRFSSFSVRASDSEGTLVLTRDRLVLVINVASETRTVAGASGEVVLSFGNTGDAAPVVDGESDAITVAGHSFVIVRRDA